MHCFNTSSRTEVCVIIALMKVIKPKSGTKELVNRLIKSGHVVAVVNSEKELVKLGGKRIDVVIVEESGESDTHGKAERSP